MVMSCGGGLYGDEQLTRVSAVSQQALWSMALSGMGESSSSFRTSRHALQTCVASCLLPLSFICEQKIGVCWSVSTPFIVDMKFCGSCPFEHEVLNTNPMSFILVKNSGCNPISLFSV